MRSGVVARLSAWIRSACRPAGGARGLAPLAMRAPAPPSVPLRSVGTCAVDPWPMPFLSISTTCCSSFAVGRHRSPPLSSPRPAPFWAWCGVRLPPPAPRSSAGLPLPNGNYIRLCSTLGRYTARHRPCIIGNNTNGHFWPFSRVLGGCWLGGGRPHHAAASALVSALKLVSSIVVRGLGFGLLLGYFWVYSGFFWVSGFLLLFVTR